MTAITVNTRLARRLLREHDARRVAEGQRVWETPDILTWPGWLARQWNELLYAGEDKRVLLSADQEMAIWESEIRGSAAGSELLNVEGAAETAAAAWRYLHEWRLPRARAAFEGVPDTEAFFEWMNAFQVRLLRGGFVTAAELPGCVHGRANFTAGFDEFTAAQREFFADASPYPEPAVEGSQQRWMVGAPDELAAAARWARERLEGGVSSVGVVLVDLAARRDAVERVFEDVLGAREAFHISTPVPLAHAPLVNAALLALKLCEGLTLAEAGALLRSPFFRHSASEGARLDLQLRRRKLSFVTLEDAEMRARFPLKPDVRARKPSGWSAQFSRLAIASGWPGPRTLSSEEYQAVESWKDLLAEFARLDAVVGELEFSAALERLRRMAERKGFGPEERGEPVQILSVAESAGARFNALWIGGLHDGAWPPPAARNPFLPVAMQRSVEDAFGFASRVTERWLNAAPVVVCSYPLHNGEEPMRPSPFIASLRELKLREEPEAEALAVWEEIPEPVGPAFAGGVQKGGTGVIRDQCDCPFRAFAKHRLGARELDEVEPGLSPRERGTLMHQALELIWAETKTQRALRAMDQAGVDELVARCVETALNTKLEHRGSRARFLEGRRMTGLLREWMAMEAGRPEFETGAVESKRMITVGGLQLEARMDRIDSYADGTVGLLDYKTGTEDKPADWEGYRPKAPQLPLYSLEMAGGVSSVMFGRVAAGKSQLVGISEKLEPGTKPPAAGSMGEQIAEWRNTMERLAGEFVRGEAAVDPRKPDVCDFCGLPGVCRVKGDNVSADD